jgi:hypothetical protein
MLILSTFLFPHQIIIGIADTNYKKNGTLLNLQLLPLPGLNTRLREKKKNPFHFKFLVSFHLHATRFEEGHHRNTHPLPDIQRKN